MRRLLRGAARLGLAVLIGTGFWILIVLGNHLWWFGYEGLAVALGIVIALGAAYELGG
jgi:hypothetical protein